MLLAIRFIPSLCARIKTIFPNSNLTFPLWFSTNNTLHPRSLSSPTRPLHPENLSLRLPQTSRHIDVKHSVTDAILHLSRGSSTPFPLVLSNPWASHRDKTTTTTTNPPLERFPYYQPTSRSVRGTTDASNRSKKISYTTGVTEVSKFQY